tara:strand:- start:600 stop:1934 length:1335 start_codon:yes stop_codon:yes gene_type:complete
MIHHQEISSISQLWSSAKEQLIQLRAQCSEAEQFNQQLRMELEVQSNNNKEDQIKHEMEKQQLVSHHETATKQLHETNINLQHEVDQLKRSVQEHQRTMEELTTTSETRDTEFDRLRQTLLEESTKTMNNVAVEDLEERLKASLQRLQTQQTLLLESRSKHSDVLAKIASMQNAVLLLQSNEKELVAERDRALGQSLVQEQRALAAEKEAEKVLNWARGTETKASHACLILNQRMEEVQNEAATVVGLQNQAQKSLVEMRQALSLCAKREGQYRAKVSSLNGEIAHLTHQKKMIDFERLAAEQEVRGVAASALKAAEQWSPTATRKHTAMGSTTLSATKRYDPTWMDPQMPRVAAAAEMESSEGTSMFDTKFESLENAARGAALQPPQPLSPLPLAPADPMNDQWFDETNRFIQSTRKLLSTGESQFGLSPVVTRPEWYPKTVR